MDTVEWAMPGLMEALVGDDVVSFQPDDEGEEQGAEDATRYVTHWVFEKNEGFTVLYEAIKSCLIQRMGVVKVYYEVETEKAGTLRRRFAGRDRGVAGRQRRGDRRADRDGACHRRKASRFRRSRSSSVAATTSRDSASMASRRKKYGLRRIRAGWRAAASSRTKSKCSYGDLLARVGQRPNWTGWRRDDPTTARWRPAMLTTPIRGNPVDESQREITVTEAYGLLTLKARASWEYRRILKGGTYIHENEVVDDHPFAVFSRS